MAGKDFWLPMGDDVEKKEEIESSDFWCTIKSFWKFIDIVME